MQARFSGQGSVVAGRLLIVANFPPSSSVPAIYLSLFTPSLPTSPPFFFPAPTSNRRVELLPACEDNHAVCSRLIHTGSALLPIAAPQLLAVH